MQIHHLFRQIRFSPFHRYRFTFSFELLQYIGIEPAVLLYVIPGEDFVFAWPCAFQGEMAGSVRNGSQREIEAAS